MDRRRLGVLLIGGGIVIGLLAGLMVFQSVSDAESIKRSQPKQRVAVAALTIPERSVITREQIAFAAVPLEAIPVGSISYPTESGTADNDREAKLVDVLINQFTPQQIQKGEAIIADRLGKEALKNTPSFVLPKGKVAYVFPLRVAGGNPPNERMFVALLNAVRPDDRIDIYYSSIEPPTGLTRDEEEKARTVDAAKNLYTRRIMQNLKVINVGYFPDTTGKAAETPREERFLTFEVTPDEALTLKWMKDVATLVGNVEFVLRSPQDTDLFPQRTVDFPTMSQQYGIGTGR
ncbi:MAG: hypothetical protein HW416_1274 [Chloroflexi bacterium]|nr:hypothetical protein [Chloroflexota bacterium]